MQAVSRRSLLVKGGVGAAGAATAFGAGWTLSSATGDDDDAALSRKELDDFSGPLVAQVTDAASGEVEVLIGERSVTFTDEALVAKLLRATR